MGITLEGVGHRAVVGRGGVYVGDRRVRPVNGGGYLMDKARFGFMDLLGREPWDAGFPKTESLFRPCCRHEMDL